MRIHCLLEHGTGVCFFLGQTDGRVCVHACACLNLAAFAKPGYATHDRKNGHLPTTNPGSQHSPSNGSSLIKTVSLSGWQSAVRCMFATNRTRIPNAHATFVYTTDTLCNRVVFRSWCLSRLHEKLYLHWERGRRERGVVERVCGWDSVRTCVTNQVSSFVKLNPQKT